MENLLDTAREDGLSASPFCLHQDRQRIQRCSLQPAVGMEPGVAFFVFFAKKKKKKKQKLAFHFENKQLLGHPLRRSELKINLTAQQVG